LPSILLSAAPADAYQGKIETIQSIPRFFASILFKQGDLDNVKPSPIDGADFLVV